MNNTELLKPQNKCYGELTFFISNYVAELIYSRCDQADSCLMKEFFLFQFSAVYCTFSAGFIFQTFGFKLDTGRI